jgi:hypothetical protein
MDVEANARSILKLLTELHPPLSLLGSFGIGKQFEATLRGCERGSCRSKSSPQSAA